MLDIFSASTHAFYRHELGDARTELETRFAHSPVRFTARGEKHGRSSFNTGAVLSWKVFENTQCDAAYDAIFADRDQSHQVTLPLRWQF